MIFLTSFIPLRLATNPGDKKGISLKLSTVLGDFSELFKFSANGFQGYPHALNRCKLLMGLNKLLLSTARKRPLATTTTTFK